MSKKKENTPIVAVIDHRNENGGSKALMDIGSE
jgi:hypothetical protein